MNNKKTYAASLQTKRALAAALKELMAQKPMEKIKIKDLTDACGIRRQNFYYHFNDIYDLMNWMFHEEALPLLEQHDGTLLWQEDLLNLFRYLEENKAVCLCALKSLGRAHLKTFFQADLHAIIQRTVEQIGDRLGVVEAGMSGDDVKLMTHFYIIAVTGVMESWITGEIDRTPEELVTFIDVMLQDHIRGAAMRLGRFDELQ